MLGCLRRARLTWPQDCRLTEQVARGLNEQAVRRSADSADSAGSWGSSREETGLRESGLRSGRRVRSWEGISAAGDQLRGESHSGGCPVSAETEESMGAL